MSELPDGQCVAIVFEAPGRAILQRSPVPAIGDDDLLVEAEMSLVSAGTERNLLLHAPRYPVLPGYSLIGTVAKLGARVTDFQVGDRVAATAAHASHVCVDQRFALKVPDRLSSAHATFFNVAAMAIHAVRLAEVVLGDPVMILGQGLIGLIATQSRVRPERVPVIGIDVSERRIEQAIGVGADLAFLAKDRLAIEAALEALPGGGPAATIELTAASGPIEMAVELTRRRGRVVAGSLVPGGHAIDLYGRAFLEGLKLVGSYMNARPYQLRAVETTSPLDWPVRPYDGGVYDGNEISTSVGDQTLGAAPKRAGAA